MSKPAVTALEPPLSLHIENLSCHYGGHTILHLPHWQLAQGEHALLLGPSGCGKTTLLHALAGLMPVQAERLEVAGQDLPALSNKQRDAWRGQRVGLVFQQLHLIGALTVQQNLLLAMPLAGAVANRDTVQHLLQTLGLATLAARKPHQLSRGQQQRAALARALVNRPRIILADEPTASLDDVHATQAIDLLLAQARAINATLVVATHDARIKPLFQNILDLTLVTKMGAAA